MEEAPVTIEVVDISEILKMLPHRYPFLLIDRIINIRTMTAASASRTSPSTSRCFMGHFPDRPVFPGVLMIEGMAQTAGVIGIKSVEGAKKPHAVYFLTIDKCKFRKPVMPGDTIEYHMRTSAAARRCGGFTAMPRSTAQCRRSRSRRDADGLNCWSSKGGALLTRATGSLLNNLPIDTPARPGNAS